jgi:bifunctional DNA-binding transcriptional regulator/antitoxin component of YhaV-PrlF toxin-antitoxin module
VVIPKGLRKQMALREGLCFCDDEG